MAHFFMRYLKNDTVGRIATSHLCASDLFGMWSPICDNLVEKHNQAVDFPKVCLAPSGSAIIMVILNLVRIKTGHVAKRMNNRWGWDSVQSGFASVPAGIDYITEQLAENPRYKGKTVKEKLFTYNPYPQYVRQVERLMRQIED